MCSHAGDEEAGAERADGQDGGGDALEFGDPARARPALPHVRPAVEVEQEDAVVCCVCSGWGVVWWAVCRGRSQSGGFR